VKAVESHGCSTNASAASADSWVTSAWFALRASSENRGTTVRKSFLANVVVGSIVPVKKPLPSGLNGAKPLPSPASVGKVRKNSLWLGKPERDMNIAGL
jgi:hypothetical protein